MITFGIRRQRRNVLTTKNLKEEIILNCEPYRLKDLNIDGNDLLKAGVEKGPKIKKILDKLCIIYIVYRLLNSLDWEKIFACAVAAWGCCEM